MNARTALILGGGGVLGAAWMAGALTALQARLSFPLGDTDVIVGTSAGSILAAALRLGLTADEISDLSSEPANALQAYRHGRALPSLPRPGIGSPRLLVTALASPRTFHPWVTFCACLPVGRTSHDPVREMIAGMPRASDSWPARGRTWIMAVDYDSGRRVAFGRPGDPRAPLAEAVAASCSLPGWFAPARIGQRRYVDGGIRSVTSADLLAGSPPKRAYVLAPLAAVADGCPRTPWGWGERAVRRMVAGATRQEVDRLRAAGTDVTLLTPSPEDLAAMGWNLMDPARREAVLRTSLRTSAHLPRLPRATAA
jgi:NTE family protein